jgi:hypothetical protein
MAMLDLMQPVTPSVRTIDTIQTQPPRCRAKFVPCVTCADAYGHTWQDFSSTRARVLAADTLQRVYAELLAKLDKICSNKSKRGWPLVVFSARLESE